MARALTAQRGSWDQKNCFAVQVCPNPTGRRMSGNQKSFWAISPATYAVRDAGSGGRYTGRRSRTRAVNTVIPRIQPIFALSRLSTLRCTGPRPTATPPTPQLLPREPFPAGLGEGGAAAMHPHRVASPAQLNRGDLRAGLGLQLPVVADQQHGLLRGPQLRLKPPLAGHIQVISGSSSTSTWSSPRSRHSSASRFRSRPTRSSAPATPPGRTTTLSAAVQPASNLTSAS